MSARKNLFEHFVKCGLRDYSASELDEVAGSRSWARSLRQLKQDGVVNFEYNTSTKSYIIIEIGEYKASSSRIGLSAKQKYKIRNRDGHRCQSCGSGVNDGVKLHVDHKIPLDWGGSHNEDNLWTLCSSCNEAKRNFYSDDFDNDVMTKVFKENSGYQRLRVLFENSPNVMYEPSVLQGIAGIRDWPRSIRNIREKYGMPISWIQPSEEYPNGAYINETG